MKTKYFFLPTLFGIAAGIPVQASHVRSADVKVERVCGTMTFKITITAYLNSRSNTDFGEHSALYFGDGAQSDLPVIQATPRPDLGENISVATYSTTHTYRSAGTFEIVYVEEHRNVGILNISNSGDIAYVGRVKINTSDTFGCNHYPVLSVAPLDGGCQGVTFYHSSGAYDIDGDSLSYELTIPGSGLNTSATYQAPNSSQFYINYSSGNEAGTGKPTFAIDQITGLVTWDAPGMSGEYNIAFNILEWRKMADGSYVQISTTTRDMQIIIQDCDNTSPDIDVPSDTCVVAGALLNAIIKGTDPEHDPVKIEVFSELLSLTVNPATYSPSSGDFVPSNPAAQTTFQWQTDCANIRQQVYQVVFKITDNPDDGPKLVTYKTWSIRVVAPAPEFTSATVDVANRFGVLHFDAYQCNNIETLQIWRKVDSYPYQPGYCVLGIPSYSGYQKIDEIEGTATTYTDTNFGKGLAVAAKYCYRLVAMVNGSKSYVSDEICLEPIQADAPVITHVSVERTSADMGNIRVRWRSPFQINKQQFPEPYEYEVYRANGFIGDTSIVKVSRVSDTTMVDPGINTRDQAFNYRIVIYSKIGAAGEYLPVDTSAAASTVKLYLTADTDAVTLHWRDSVPWSNVSVSRPYHLIYRSEGLDSDEQTMQLLDSVEVTANGFNFTDDTPRNSNNLYYYKVLTRGTYGNPLIPVQENLSQRLSVLPSDEIKPCAPVVTVDKTDCQAYVAQSNCSQSSFSNKISWSASTASSTCRQDIVAYNIYASTETAGEFILLATVSANEFSDTNLTSLARCYKVSAVDSGGNEGPMSDPVCNDNCPYFELPNVFTPNGDECNDLFTSRYDAVGTSTGSCGDAETFRCPRFVKSVSIVIYNRWGTEVYRRSDSIFIDWNGKTNDGVKCSPGVYFYQADVEFLVIDKSNSKITLKGWVQILY